MDGLDGVFDPFLTGAGIMIIVGILLMLIGVAVFGVQTQRRAVNRGAIMLVLAALVLFGVGMYTAVTFSGTKAWGEAGLKAVGSLDPVLLGLSAVITLAVPALIAGTVIGMSKYYARRSSS